MTLSSDIGVGTTVCVALPVKGASHVSRIAK
jgi:hypothetical protein